jgi:SAM-dependent methyltransferase
MRHQSLRAHPRVSQMIDHVTMRQLLLDDAPRAADTLRTTLDSLPSHGRDAWLDRVFDVDSLAADGHELPRGCVPYMPCPVDLLLQMVDGAQVENGDVFVDIGSGVGRAVALVHCLTAAGAIGIEIQPNLVESSRALARDLNKSRIAIIKGDAVDLVTFIQTGTVFFLYCPFSGERFERVLDELQGIAMTRPIRICCLGLPVVNRPWLELMSPENGELLIYRSITHTGRFR